MPKTSRKAKKSDIDDIEAPAKKAPKAKKVPLPAPSMTDETYAFAVEAARMARDDKCEDVALLDVRELSQVTDYIVIGTGSSDRQMHSVLKHIEEDGKAKGMPCFRSNADDRSTWLLADFVNVVVHLFEPNTRAHYDLEMLWGDAPRLQWERPDQLPRDRAGLHTKPKA